MRTSVAVRIVMPRLLAYSLLSVLALTGCKSDSADSPPPVDGTGPDDTGETQGTTTTDTSFPIGDEGSMMLVEDARGLGLYAMFVNQQPGFDNLAYCGITGTVCINGFPATTDTSLAFDITAVFEPGFSQYSYVGDTVSLGPYIADLYYNAEEGIAFYYANLDGADQVLGPVGVSFGGQWGEYAGDSDIELKEPIEIVVPMAGQTLRTVNAQAFAIEWIPVQGEGDLHLFASTGEPNYLAVQWLLEDDGYFEVPIDDLMLGGIDPEDGISFTLQRWNRGTVTHRGNTLDIVQISDLTFFADYDYVGSRSEIVPADNCAQAVNMVPVSGAGTYSYWGRMLGFANDLGDQCGIGSSDAEGLIAVTLPALTAVTVEYNLPLAEESLTPESRDAAIWITDDCSDGSACLAGSNVNDDYISDLTQHFNTSNTEEQTVYIVLGGAGTTSDVFLLDVVIQQLEDPLLADECLEATQAVALGEGSYYSEDVSFLDSLNPGLACTNSQTPGPDAMNKVTLQNGETLTALLQMPGADPALYLLYNCTQPNTCAVGADATLGPNEIVAYTNNSGFSENLYLVVDTKGAPMLPYFLTIDITP